MDDRMDNFPPNQDIFVSKARHQYGFFICQYWDLSIKKSLSEIDGERLQVILDLAQDDELLSFVLDEVDHLLGHECGLVDSKSIQAQQEKFQGMLQQKFPAVLDHAWLEYTISHEVDVQKREVSLRAVQMALYQVGVYQGKIDGEYGPKTKEAFQSLKLKLEKQNEKPQDVAALPKVPEGELINLIREKRELTSTEQFQLLDMEAQFIAAC
jgi:uncharacterized Fe-S cluster-containing protein